ncbi:MAG: UDP-glucose/GDP-mannose dehydrogenase family protein [Bacteroidales bacterium]|nr:UDP-glucose/GDP-mannose dehydrogenase family protein [Bacteroidales bacterium]MBQ2573850.1 UDP-glucose/GDP-mannose dehydrogenase family protein [Bacteroidales bacterium]MBQ3989742.1 UDP-glucose/GDP-mannose dehydrogenase family protein [Bacteroidales bacterium]
MKIAVIGTGYVGLVSGTCFSELGVRVSCLDIDQKKIDNLNKGILPIWEPGLKDMVDDNMHKGLLSFTSDYAEALKDAEAAFICVGTPPDEDGSADLQYVLAVAREIGRNISDYIVVVTKSTVPIGTSEKVRKAVADEIAARKVDIKFDVASNPEFLKEGSAVADFMKPDRVVVGVDSEEAKELMTRLYRPMLLNNFRVIFTDIPSAEMIKYAANSMLATRISFMNDLANLCELVGADINMVRKGIGSDTRIGSKFLYPGCGYGGSCFPKDVKALIKSASDYDYSLEILKSVENINNRQKEILFNKVYKYFDGNLKGKKIAMWGLAFKPNTDDMREAPSLILAEKFTSMGAKIFAYDPVAMDEAKRRLGDKITFCKSPYEATENADALLLVTEWSEFRVLDYKLLEKMKQKLIFDGRNIYDPAEVRKYGFQYFGIGRK